MENVAVVGASSKEDRYSNKAMKLLEKKGHNPIPISQAGEDVLGRQVYASLSDVKESIDTVTMYVGTARQGEVLEEILKLKPNRVIFNPGTENPNEYARLKAADIEVLEACTLVMLKTGSFESETA